MNLDLQSTAMTTALYIAYKGQRKLRSFFQTGIKSQNAKNPKQQQKDKVTGFKLKRNLLLISVSP